MLELEPRADEPLFGGCNDAAIANAKFTGGTGAPCAGSVDGLDLDHVTPGLSAECPGVHRERSAERPGNPGEELRGSQAPFHALLREPRAGHTGSASNLRLVGALQIIERAVRRDHDAAQAAIAHQHIAAETNPVKRRAGRQAAQECREILGVARLEVGFRRATDMPRGVARHRFVVHDPAAVFGADGDRVHLLLPRRPLLPSCVGSSWEIAPMLPAPMVTTTSPSRSTSASAVASPSTRSTKIGSTWPRERTALQIARPSAPAMGVSPAA